MTDSRPDSSDAEVQNALNPNPDGLNEHDPNVARDPVCGMLVDKRTANDTLAAPVNEKGIGMLYFCSADCKALFEANPAQYGFPSL
jgi:YHS domain-containing protein